MAGTEDPPNTDPPADPPADPPSAADPPPADPPAPADPPPADPPADPPPKQESLPGVTESDPLKDPRVVEAIARERKAAADKARRDAKTQADAEAKTAKEKEERAKLEETDRLKLEKKDEEEKAKIAVAQAESAERRLEMRDVILNDRIQLQEGAIEFLEAKVAAAMKQDGDLTVELAVRAAVEKHKYLVVTGEVPPPKKEPVSTEPPKPGETPTPGTPPPKEGVDANKMSGQEFKDHLREQYGAETRH